MGKTEFSIEKRFKEHCNASTKIQNEHRPLYSAMRKYGIEHFHIELIEETDKPEEREIYWIEQKRSFKNGYNATMGGDGKKYIDYDLVIAAYEELQSIIEVANKLNINEDTVSKIISQSNIKKLTSAEVNLNKLGHIINQYDLKGNYIKTFPSFASAIKELKGDNYSKGAITHLKDVCEGKRKTAYGFIWKYSK